MVLLVTENYCSQNAIYRIRLLSSNTFYKLLDYIRQNIINTLYEYFNNLTLNDGAVNKSSYSKNTTNNK